MLVAELRILHVAGMAVRETERSPFFGAWFSSSGGMSSPSRSRPLSVNHSSRVRGCQSKPTRVAHAARENFRRRAVRLHPQDRGEPRIVGALADIARPADRHVEQAVGSERDELLAVMRLGRQILVDDHRLRADSSSFASMSS